MMSLPSRPESDAQRLPADRGVCRVVLCDDNVQYRQMIATVVSLEAGLEVVGEAADGREGVALVERSAPDVVVLDVAMPNMDGLEALRQIRRRMPEAAVLMLTGFDEPKVREQTRALGAAGYLVKGVAPNDLVRAIRDACAGRDGR